ncbi:uncharacterized protein L199_001467 [Kwoniella botswanensis]|uniref:uncharacterized protein n=1 Tax=Kwoniella botswanensis TaxID=1268659 RepID=UPI00315D980B
MSNFNFDHPTPTSSKRNIIDLTLDDDDDSFSGGSPSDNITQTFDMDLFNSTTEASSGSQLTERFEDDFSSTASNFLPIDKHIDLALATFNNNIISGSIKSTKSTNQFIPTQDLTHDSRQYQRLDPSNVCYPYEVGQYTQPYPRADKDWKSDMDEVTLYLTSLIDDLAESEKNQDESLGSIMAIASRVEHQSRDVEQTLNVLQNSLMAQKPTSTSTIDPSQLHTDADPNLEQRLQDLENKNRQLENENERLQVSSLEYQLSCHILRGQLAERDLQMMQCKNK